MFLALCCVLNMATPEASTWRTVLPADAVIVESTFIRAHPDRVLVLWVLNPEKHSYPIEPDEPYDTCWLETHGSQYYRARTRVSLVDARRNRLINTVVLETPGDVNLTLDIPLQIRRGRYHVPTQSGDGKPQIMRLRDYNGDGRPLEFVIYVTETCSMVSGTLLGYSERQDKVIWYSIDLSVDDEGSRETTTGHWSDGLFDQERKAVHGRWQFTREYPEEPPRIYRFDIRYDKGRERFQGTEIITQTTR